MRSDAPTPDGAARRDPRRLRARRGRRAARADRRGGDRALRADAAGRLAARARPRARAPDEERAAFGLQLNAVNFGSGWFPTLRKPPGLSRLPHRRGAALQARGPWTAEALRRVDAAEVAAAFGQDPGTS